MSEFILGQYAPRAIVSFNDWDPVTRPILIAAKSANIPTIAIVEGIQDYDDVDVHWRRYAYKTSDIVLLPGEFDRKYFKEHSATVAVGGIPRLEALRKASPRHWENKKNARVLINSNFSYGVLEEHRDRWVADCVEVVRELGFTPVISRHPADKGDLFRDLVSRRSFYEEVEDCDVSIQRFASGVLEALAREVGVVYYNPHYEKVDKFQSNPMDAYVLAFSRDELKSALSGWWQLHLMAKDRGGEFLDLHAGEISYGAINRCADALDVYKGPTPGHQQLRSFKQSLEAIDAITAAFSIVRPEGQPIFPDPEKALDRMVAIWQQVGIKSSVGTVKPLPRVEKKDVGEAPAEKDRLDLPSLTAQLLLDPQSGRARLQKEADAVSRALAALPENSPVRQHFQRVRAFAEAS